MDIPMACYHRHNADIFFQRRTTFPTIVSEEITQFRYERGVTRCLVGKKNDFRQTYVRGERVGYRVFCRANQEGEG